MHGHYRGERGTERVLRFKSVRRVSLRPDSGGDKPIIRGLLWRHKPFTGDLSKTNTESVPSVRYYRVSEWFTPVSTSDLYV